MNVLIRNVFSKFTVFLLVTLLVLTPLNGVFNFKIQAENIWAPVTDEAFADSNLSIKKIVFTGSYLYFYTDKDDRSLSVYQSTGPGMYDDISTEFYEDPDNNYIIDIAVTNDGLYAVVDNTNGFKVFAYDYDSEEWSDVTEDFSELNNIIALETVEGGLLVWANYTYDQDLELSGNFLFIYYEDNLEPLSNPDSFAPYNSNSLVLKKLVYFFAGLLIVFEDTDSGDSVLFGYVGGGENDWVKIFDIEDNITDVAFTGSTFLFLTEYSDAPLKIYAVTGEDTFIPVVDDGFGNPNNKSGKFIYLNDNLYVVTSNTADGSQIYRSEDALNWTSAGDFVGEQQEDPSDRNSIVTSVTSLFFFDAFAFIGVSKSDIEGNPISPSLWLFQPGVPDADDLVHNSNVDGDDECRGPFPVGFDFNFFGENFSSAYVNSNGTLNFDECYDGYENVDLTNSETWEDTEGVIPNTIYAYWDDLDSNDFKDIFYQTIGTEEGHRIFVVQWTNHYHHYNTEAVPLGTFQVILFEETGQIQLQYKYLLLGQLGKGWGATVGLSKDEENVVQYSYNTPSLSDGKAILFTPLDDTYTIDDTAEYIDIYLTDSNIPTVPTLTYPSNGQTNVSLVPTLAWNVSAGAQYYELMIATSSDFEKGLDNDEEDLDPEDIPDNTVVVQLSDIYGTAVSLGSYLGDLIDAYEENEFSGLEPNTQYYWMVKAVGSVNTEVSEIHSFTTGEFSENDGPNNGDANGDDIPDIEQANVTTFINPLTGKFVVLESSCAVNRTVAMVSADSLGADNGFTYSEGLMHFELECEEGQIATIKQFFYGNLDSSLIVARKYSDVSGYKTIAEAEISNTKIGDLDVLIVSYEIEDGGELDEDGLPNGIIVDPSGPAFNSAGVPNTGLGKILLL